MLNSMLFLDDPSLCLTGDRGRALALVLRAVGRIPQAAAHAVHVGAPHAGELVHALALIAEGIGKWNKLLTNDKQG